MSNTKKVHIGYSRSKKIKIKINFAGVAIKNTESINKFFFFFSLIASKLTKKKLNLS